MFVLSGMQWASASEKTGKTRKSKKLVLTNYLNAKMLDGVKRSKKKIDKGVLITFKTKKAAKLDLLRRLFDHVRQESAKPEAGSGHENELLYWKEVSWTANRTEKELKIEITTEKPELVKKIRKVGLPPAVFKSGFQPAITETSGSEDIE